MNRSICIHLLWDYYSESFLSVRVSEEVVLNLPSQPTLQTKQNTPGFWAVDMLVGKHHLTLSM